MYKTAFLLKKKQKKTKVLNTSWRGQLPGKDHVVTIIKTGAQLLQQRMCRITP